MNDPYDTVAPSPDAPKSTVDFHDPDAPPSQIGRYRVQKILGKGGFGLVYLAYDEQLKRAVAIKVAHARLISQASDAEAYLTEARTVANLDHPNIVPVFDVGSTEQFPCFVVSKYIDGNDLFTRLKQSRLPLSEAVELMATVAEALHHAHKQEIVHRDIKPGNILLDKSGKPFVADFGLALREQDVGKVSGFAGTPAYMSPEQARGEGHRVDGRSDVFSLGIVFYEMLTGRRPFKAESTAELLVQITTFEPRPLRQVDDHIPKELERICLKALAKRASERYSTAKDVADDLRHWISTTGEDGRPREAESKPVKLEPAIPGVTKDVFLSYATPDKEDAFRLCRLLEEKGISCWIAPRDVPPGGDYGEAIVRAIERTGTTILFLSAHANASVHVKHEVERATSKGKRVIPVRLADVPLGPSLELHLAASQWVDGFRLSPEKVAEQLAVVLLGQNTTPSPAITPPVTPPVSDQRHIKIVPKGLRSFDAHDADFFLELLPGPRDRDGLPDSIRFWKTRIEEMDADNTFSVGLIYGPSGCGKSSLMKAGLLPRLSENVIAVYLEATAEETETRLLNGLRKHCPALPANLGLKETLAALRRGQGIPVGKKVAIILDQFEQWLHAKKDEENTELVQALRQCDGGRAQCIVMVRDDFWMAVTRFLTGLEIELLQGRNCTAADLFDIDHAKKVLIAFGCAFGKLPEKFSEASKEQKEFVSQAVSGLAQENKVICVRLALFAEMMKGRHWTPATLKEVGGTEGVGVTFLEDTFSSPTANPKHRYHQKAARAVLKSLLPESGTDIKGHMRSHAELLEASGYASRPKDFDELIRILDGEIRLITPTDPEGKEGESSTQARVAAKYYQLTHDYLVPSLRDWLTRKQKETRRGRAELLLADRTAVWNARPENRQLPSLWQWASIRWLTQNKNWTPPQRKMMRQATRYHVVRAMVVGVFLSLIGWGGYEAHGRQQAYALQNRLFDANTNEVPKIVADMAPYRRWIDPLLHEAYAQAEGGSDGRKQLHASLALLPIDSTHVNYLCGRLLEADPHEFPVIRDALAPHKGDLVDKLWSVLDKPGKGNESQRLRAAAAIAKYDPESKKWEKVQEAVGNYLVSVPAMYLVVWLESFRPVRAQLRTPLAAIFRDVRRRDAERLLATDILFDYAADQPQVLADLLMDADEKQFAVIYPKLKDHSEHGISILTCEIDKKLPSELPSSDERREILAKRQANAAVALLKLNQPENVWPLLKHRSDPRARSYLIHRLGPLGADPKAIVKRLDEETDLTIRRALLLSLGEYDKTMISLEDRIEVLPKIQEIYCRTADPGLHAAAEWLLRTWNKEVWLKQVNEEWANDKQQRQKRLEGIKHMLAREKEKSPPQWYVNCQGQTMIVISGQVEFVIGSPVTEVGRQKNETRHKKRIGRTFALASKLVTVEEYRQFNKGHTFIGIERVAPTPDCPVGHTAWFGAAAYCNWLSKEEGIDPREWCYEADSKGKLKENYLSLTGYRLPTEAEMEYATRAGALTSRYYGETDDLLPKYAWYQMNSQQRTWPVGTLKPNDLGFFDVQGNAYSWCQESYKSYPAESQAEEPKDDKEFVEHVIDSESRVLRGGAWFDQGADVRSAVRYSGVPNSRNSGYGFRPARTLTP